jgi:hypothetical protein
MAENTSGSGAAPSDSPLNVGWGFCLWWVLASTVGWAAGGFLSGAVPVGGFLGWAALGAVYGAITGSVLVWLLRQPVPATSAEE